MLAPHSRLLQFLQSHFNATRLGSADTQKRFLRLLSVTLDAFVDVLNHPNRRNPIFALVYVLIMCHELHLHGLYVLGGDFMVLEILDGFFVPVEPSCHGLEF